MHLKSAKTIQTLGLYILPPTDNSSPSPYYNQKNKKSIKRNKANTRRSFRTLSITTRSSAATEARTLNINGQHRWSSQDPITTLSKKPPWRVAVPVHTNNIKWRPYRYMRLEENAITTPVTCQTNQNNNRCSIGENVEGGKIPVLDHMKDTHGPTRCWWDEKKLTTEEHENSSSGGKGIGEHCLQTLALGHQSKKIKNSPSVDDSPLDQGGIWTGYGYWRGGWKGGEKQKRQKKGPEERKGKEEEDKISVRFCAPLGSFPCTYARMGRSRRT